MISFNREISFYFPENLSNFALTKLDETILLLDTITVQEDIELSIPKKKGRTTSTDLCTHRPSQICKYISIVSDTINTRCDEEDNFRLPQYQKRSACGRKELTVISQTSIVNPDFEDKKPMQWFTAALICRNAIDTIPDT